MTTNIIRLVLMLFVISSLKNLCANDEFFPSKLELRKAMLRQTDASLILAKCLMETEALGKNFVFSPMSINFVLSLLAAGSEGKTLDELLSFLKSENRDELEKLMSEIIIGNLLVDGEGKGGPKLSIANAVWIDESLKLEKKFLQVVDKAYKSDIKKVDFRTQYLQVTKEVNSWVKGKTNGLIKEILPPGSVNELTRNILTNAIYFKGSWTQTFDPSMTKNRPFHLLSGARVNVPFMTNRNDQYVEQFDGFKVLGLPYKSGEDERKFSMYIFLPDAKTGLPKLVKKLSSQSDFIDKHIPFCKDEVRRFLVPKFKISSEFEGSEVLKSLGLESVFDHSNALSVSSIFHKSFIEVSEEGTEAAAVTGMYLGACESSSKPINFIADHPFLFVIREDNTRSVLFVGQVHNPLDTR